MGLDSRPIGVQRRQEFLVVSHGAGGVVTGVGDEAGWDILGDAVAGGEGVDFRLGRLGSQEIVVRDALGEGGAEQADEGAAGFPRSSSGQG